MSKKIWANVQFKCFILQKKIIKKIMIFNKKKSKEKKRENNTAKFYACENNFIPGENQT